MRRLRPALQPVEPSTDWRDNLPPAEREVLERITDSLARHAYEVWLRRAYGL